MTLLRGSDPQVGNFVEGSTCGRLLSVLNSNFNLSEPRMFSTTLGQKLYSCQEATSPSALKRAIMFRGKRVAWPMEIDSPWK